MNEMYIDGFVTKLNYIIPNEYLNIIKDEMIKYSKDFKISKNETSIQVYKNIFPNFYENYFVIKKIEGLTESILRSYKNTLNRFFNAVCKEVNDITSEDVYVFLYNIQKHNNISNRTLEHNRMIICTFFRWAYNREYIKKDIALSIKPIKFCVKEKSPLTRKELAMVRYSCKNEQEHVIVETLYSTGCRVSELINIKITDINFDNGEVVVFGKGEKYRTVYLNDTSMIYIQKYLKTRKDTCPYLIVSSRGNHQVTRRAIELIVENVGKNANLTRKLHPHLIRHTMSTIGLSSGMSLGELQSILGHSNISTTTIYAKSLKDDIKSHHKKYIV